MSHLAESRSQLAVSSALIELVALERVLNLDKKQDLKMMELDEIVFNRRKGWISSLRTSTPTHRVLANLWRTLQVVNINKVSPRDQFLPEKKALVKSYLYDK